MSQANAKDFRIEPVNLSVTLSSDEKKLLMDFFDFLERHVCFPGDESQVQFLMDTSILKDKEAWPDFMKEEEQICDQVLACLESKFSDVVREAGSSLNDLLPFVMLYKVKSCATKGDVHVDMSRLDEGDYATLIIPITEHKLQGTTVFPLGEIDYENKIFTQDIDKRNHAVAGSYIFGGHVPHFHEANLSRLDRRAIMMTFTIEDDDPSFGLPLSPFAERIRDEEMCAAAAILVSLKNA